MDGAGEAGAVSGVAVATELVAYFVRRAAHEDARSAHHPQDHVATLRRVALEIPAVQVGNFPDQLGRQSVPVPTAASGRRSGLVGALGERLSVRGRR